MNKNNRSIELKRVDRCTFEEVLELWNGGFQEYYSDMSKTQAELLQLQAESSFHPELFVAAFVDGEPAGFVFTGLKKVDGKSIAWNGGTGVKPKFRGMGISTLIMKEIVRVLQEKGVHEVWLEVVCKNKNAIAAYKRAGFTIVDELTGMYLSGAFERLPFQRSQSMNYSTVIRKAVEVSRLPFYQHKSAWFSQWFNLSEGEAMLIFDTRWTVVGYALFMKGRDESNNLTSIVLHQCEADPEREDAEDIIRYTLSKVYEPYDLPVKRLTENVRLTNKHAIDALKGAGFATEYDQYLMHLRLGG